MQLSGKVYMQNIVIDLVFKLALTRSNINESHVDKERGTDYDFLWISEGNMILPTLQNILYNPLWVYYCSVNVTERWLRMDRAFQAPEKSAGLLPSQCRGPALSWAFLLLPESRGTVERMLSAHCVLLFPESLEYDKIHCFSPHVRLSPSQV